MTRENKKMDRPYRKMEEYVRENQKGLRREYGKKYLAIQVNGNEVSIIDSDNDKFILSGRIERSPKKPRIYITDINRITSPVVGEMSSPEGESR